LRRRRKTSNISSFWVTNFSEKDAQIMDTHFQIALTS